MRKVSAIPLAVALLAVTAATSLAQERTWHDRWYWGAQGGVLLFDTPTQSWDWATVVGGHWFITKRTVGLYIGFDQVIFKDATTSAVANGASPTGVTQVSFSNSQRIQAVLYALPSQGQLDLHLGGGFAIHHVTDAEVFNPGAATDQELEIAVRAIDEASSDAFLVLGGGFEWRLGRWSWYADYHYMPSSNEFLINSAQHSFLSGLRYALTSAQTAVGTQP